MLRRKIVLLLKLTLVLAMASLLVGQRPLIDWIVDRPGPQVRLFNAIAASDTGAVDSALAEGAVPNDAGDSYMLPLNYAASIGRLEIIKRLLSSGADVNAVD